MSFELSAPQVSIFRATNGYILLVGGKSTNRRWLADAVTAILKFVPQLPVQLQSALKHMASGDEDLELTTGGIRPKQGSPVQVGEAISDQVAEVILPITEELKAKEPRVYVCQNEAHMLALLAELYGMGDVWDMGMDAASIVDSRQTEDGSAADDAADNTEDKDDRS